MLRASISAGLGALFVVLGAMNVWLIFHASRRLQYRIAKCPADACASVGGYVFILLFCVMTYFMLLKIEDTGSLQDAVRFPFRVWSVSGASDRFFTIGYSFRIPVF